MPILVLNAGSSSLKCALFQSAPGGPVVLARRKFEVLHEDSRQVVAESLAWAETICSGRPLEAVGHRVVHGGEDFHAPVVLSAGVLAALERLTPLAPLHQPPALEAARALMTGSPGTPQVACFDTAFHWDQPMQAQRLGLPRALAGRGLRRYGLHGLNYQHVAERLARLDPTLASGRVVAAHLGSGASLCALAAGRSIDTTMGFSPLDGLLMATRCGALDPGVVLFLLQHDGMTVDQIQDLLYRRSGLLGVSGLTGDMRALLDSCDPAAGEAVELFVYRAVKEIAALAGALGGLDGLVFTAGIGEGSPEVRTRIASRLRWLGLRLDEEANFAGGERRISAPGSRLKAWVIPADEERVIACQTAAALGLDPAQG